MARAALLFLPLSLALSLALASAACQAPLEATISPASSASPAPPPSKAKDGRMDLTLASLTGYVLDGGLRADAVVQGRRIMFIQRGEGWDAVTPGEAILRTLADHRFQLELGRDLYLFTPIAPVTEAMTQPARGGIAAYAAISEARFADGETWQWHYETQEVRTHCEPKGRFGLTNPDCRIRRYTRPIEIRSSRGQMVKLDYAASQAGPEYNHATGASLYRLAACRDGEACPAARMVRTVKLDGSTAIPPP